MSSRHLRQENSIVLKHVDRTQGGALCPMGAEHGADTRVTFAKHLETDCLYLSTTF